MKIFFKTASLFLIPILSMGIVFAQEDVGDEPLPPEGEPMLMEEQMPPQPEMGMMDMEKMRDFAPEDYPMMHMGRRAMMMDGMGDHRQDMGSYYDSYSKKDHASYKKGSCLSKYSKWGHKNWGGIILWKLGKLIGGVIILFLATFVIRKSWDFAGKFPKKK